MGTADEQALQRRCRECGHGLGGEVAEWDNWTVCGGGEHCWCLAKERELAREPDR